MAVITRADLINAWFRYIRSPTPTQILISAIQVSCSTAYQLATEHRN